MGIRFSSHLRVSRQREEFANRVALRLIQSNDLIAYELRQQGRSLDLNVRGIVRNRHLAKSIADAGWSLFRRWLEYFGYKYGKGIGELTLVFDPAIAAGEICPLA